MGKPVGKRFGQMLNNIKDRWISFGSNVYRIGLKKRKSVGIWKFRLEKIPFQEKRITFQTFRLFKKFFTW